MVGKPVFLAQISRLFQGQSMRAQLLRGGIGSLLVKVGYALLGFGVAVVLARLLGPEGYGVYSFALAIIMLTAIPSQVGLPQLVVRETARAQVNGNYGLMRGLWRWANIAVILFSGLALIAMVAVLSFKHIGSDSSRVATLVIGVGLIPIIALANVRGACLRGLRKVVQGQLPESIIRPGLLLFFALTWGYLFTDNPLTPEGAMGLYVIAAIIAFIIGAWLLHHSRPTELNKRPVPEFQSSAWRKAVIPLALITGLQLANNYADLVMLGIFRTDEEVGIYRAVFQLSLLVIFGLQAINQVLQPHFARLYEEGDIPKLQRLVTSSTRMILVLAIPPLVIFIVFGEDLLSWVFGDAFRAGGMTLVFLAVGQFVNAGVGPVAMLLNMTGHERDTVRGVAVAAVSNVVLNIVLIPPLGMVGAGLASAITLLIWNVLLMSLVKKRLFITVSPL